MKKQCKLWAFLVMLVIVIALGIMLSSTIGKHRHRFDNPDEFIGMTAEEVINRCGKFDRCTFWETSGKHRSGIYVIRPENVVHEWLELHIYFDEDGVATSWGWDGYS